MTGDDDLRVTAADIVGWARAALNGPPGSEANRRVLLLIAEVRDLRARKAELQQRIDNALAVCAQLSPSVAAVRAALTGTQNDPDQVAADQGRTGLGKD